MLLLQMSSPFIMVHNTEVWNCGGGTSLVIALLYSLCIHTIGLRLCVHNFLSDLVTACNKSPQKTRVTNLLSKALQDNMHEVSKCFSMAPHIRSHKVPCSRKSADCRKRRVLSDMRRQ